MNIMESRNNTILPRLEKLLAQLGENLKLARLRRKLTTQQVAERAGITRTTLWQVEKGAPHVGMGAYAQVLFVLGMEKDLLKLATDGYGCLPKMPQHDGFANSQAREQRWISVLGMFDLSKMQWDPTRLVATDRGNS